MSRFIGLNRICVPLSLDCDLSCRYCYRNAGRIPRIPEFNDLMREYLGQLDPKKTQALVASGGEPLLHWDKVLELFSYAPADVHKKVMTNGLNLTEDIVEYLNANRVEVFLSHDGDATAWLRGVDVLDEPRLKNLIEKIDHLTFSCCCTAKNPDPYQCYEEIKARVSRHFWFHYNAVYADKFCNYLTQGFDYKAYRRGALLCRLKKLDWVNPIPLFFVGTGCNVLPNGDLVGMAEIHHKYGTVLDTVEMVLEKQRQLGDRVPCENSQCEIHGLCNSSGHTATPHHCNIIRCMTEISNACRRIGK